MSGKSGKRPKETDQIKALLEEYIRFQRRVDNTEERLEFLRESVGSPSSPCLTGMPGGSRDGSSKQERDLIKTEELEEKLRDMYAEESRKREEIEAIIEKLQKPDEQTAVEMRYFDNASWRAICAALHGGEEDFEENEQKYLKRTFKIHGSALLAMAKIYKASKGEQSTWTRT